VNFEWIRTTLPPHCDAGLFPAYAPGSHEYVAVESGTLRLSIADVAHGYANATLDPCAYHVAALIMRPRRPALRPQPASLEPRMATPPASDP
jgi:XRE family transcriptional regulator, regulator of sulfur utilization